MQIQQVVFSNWPLLSTFLCLKIAFINQIDVVKYLLTSTDKPEQNVKSSVPFCPSPKSGVSFHHCTPGTVANPLKKTCAKDTQKLFKLYFSYKTFLLKKKKSAFTLLFKIQGHKHTENVKYCGSICTRELFESCCCRKKEPERGCVSLCTHNCFWRRDSQHWIKCIESDTEIYLNTKICIQQWCYYHCTLSDEML